MARQRLARYGWLLCLLFAVTARAQDDLVIAWAAQGTLYVQQNGETTALTENNAIQPFISPDGAQIAYTAGEDQLPESLWLADRLLVSREQIAGVLIDQVAWWDETTLCFNTSMPNPPFGMLPQDDLWCVQDGLLNNVLPAGSGGAFDISPTGDQVAIVRAGAFDDSGEVVTEGDIRVMTPGGTSAHTLHTFPPIQNGTHSGGYPRVYWLPDGEALYAAIPPAFGEMALWRLHVDGNAQQIGAVSIGYGVFLGWSADRERLAYAAAPPSATQGATITLANADGSEAQVIAEDVRGLFTWAAQGRAYAYTPSDLEMQVNVNGKVFTLEGTGGVRRVRLVDEQTLIYSDDSGLRLANIDGESAAITTLAEAPNPLFDVERRR